MPTTTDVRANFTEVKLLLALISSTKLPSIPWATVVTGLDCNSKAAQERWRRFKLKHADGGNKPVTPAEVDLLLAIVSAIQLTGVDWAAVSKELGCNSKAAQERWRRFKLKLPAQSVHQKNGAAADATTAKPGEKTKKAAKITNGGGGAKSSPATTKRKVEEESEWDDGKRAANEGASVGGVSRPAMKRSRFGGEETVENGIDTKEGDDDDKGEGSENEAEFYEAEEGYGEDAYHGDSEDSEHEI